MTDQSKRVFGIDLGTTYSCIAYVDEHGKPVVGRNMENQSITPSVVFFDGDNVIVGDVAKENARLEPDLVVQFIKRAMGDPNYAFDHDGKILKPEEISSYILRKLVTDAGQNLGEEVTDVVITVPAYFGINEREATKVAGEIAGLNVRGIINEPTAAAIAYGMAEADREQVVLVYDLGGGTFDITMIAITAEAIDVICTGGDHNLGGKDWDDCIVGYLIACFEEEQGTSADELLDDPETRQDLILAAERAKKTLTQRDKAAVSVNHDGERVRVELTREKFEELTRHLLEKTIALTEEMLAEAKKKGHEQFDEILLVGGSTRMTQVAARVQEAFGKSPQVFDPDESVAKGAALYGWKLTLNDALVARIAEATGQSEAEVREAPQGSLDESVVESAQQDVAENFNLTIRAVKSSGRLVRNVCSKSFGVVAIDSTDGQERVYNLILKNTTVPVDTSQRFGTHEENQENVLIRIMENEVGTERLEIPEAVEIGTAELEIPPNMPAGSPLEITFTLNDEGRLEMKAVELKENREVKATIQTNSVISGEELEAAKARSQAMVLG